MRVNVRVFPRAKRPRIEATSEGLKVFITSVAIEGRANKKLIEVLADYFHTKKYKIAIIKGHKQRDKVVEILS